MDKKRDIKEVVIIGAVLFIVVGAIVSFLNLYSSTESTTPTESSTKAGKPTPIRNIKYKVVDKDVYDIPLKTQLSVNVILDSDIKVTEGNIRQVLRKVFDDLKRSRGYTHHRTPTHINFRLYMNDKDYENDENIGAVLFVQPSDLVDFQATFKRYSDGDIRIIVDEEILERYSE